MIGLLQGWLSAARHTVRATLGAMLREEGGAMLREDGGVMLREG
jgi:hypothetical protein